MSGASTILQKIFQSTPPRGGRPHRVQRPLPLPDFNPRPREGGDLVARHGDHGGDDFNPRPREGGDADSAPC